MAKQRIVNTKFWDDSYIACLAPTEKLVFLYLLTSPLTNISGVYELPLKRAAFDVGVEEGVIEEVFRKLEKDKKIVREGSWVGIVNFIRHQTLNPKVRQGIATELRKAPPSLLEAMQIDFDSLSIAYGSLSHLNPNSNTNGRKDSLSDEGAIGYRGRARQIGERWRVKG
jgi:hypothetical protein